MIQGEGTAATSIHTHHCLQARFCSFGNMARCSRGTSSSTLAGGSVLCLSLSPALEKLSIGDRVHSPSPFHPDIKHCASPRPNTCTSGIYNTIDVPWPRPCCSPCVEQESRRDTTQPQRCAHTPRRSPAWPCRCRCYLGSVHDDQPTHSPRINQHISRVRYG